MVSLFIRRYWRVIKDCVLIILSQKLLFLVDSQMWLKWPYAYAA